MSLSGIMILLLRLEILLLKIEQDLQELFRPFGPVTRIYVAFNRETGESRGFAFVNMVNKEDGERAIAKLDGYGYDNLILRVEWAEKRPERQ